jgi:FKBP-type peptidyl-prolyl cis-trans isomerase
MPRATFRALGALLLTPLALLTGCSDASTAPDIPSNPAVETYAPALGVNIAAMTKRGDALYIQDLTVGTGAEAVSGRVLRMTYTGWLINGQRFDTNVGGAPFSFTLGAGMVISGWDQGVAGMKVGGKRKLVIGSALGYGRSGSGPIPPNATLVFDVELVGVQ